MRAVLFCAAILISSCAQAKTQQGTRPSAKAQPANDQTFVLTPTTHVCVSAFVSDDIPELDHSVFTDTNYSRSFGRQIIWALEHRKGTFAQLLPQFHLVPDTWNEKCKLEASPILISIRYTINRKARPFRVEWSISKGTRRIERKVERDIDQEIAEGTTLRFDEENLTGEVLAEDIRKRAAEIAALIK